MEDVRPKLSHDPSNGSIDFDDSEDEQAQESPTKIKIYKEEDIEQHQPQNTSSEYIRPRVRISSEHERASLDEIEFSGDEADTPSTPARIETRLVDTSAPIESVKHAVSRFGGTVDWKSHKNFSFEKRKNIDKELEKTQEEIPLFKKQTEAAEEAKTQVFKDLEATNQLIEDLELSLEKAKGEENKARRDYDVVDLRIKEMENGINDVAFSEELEVARSKYEAAVSELKSVKEEVESLRKEYSSLFNEKEGDSIKAEEALSSSKNVQKILEELSKELVSMKESLEAEKQRVESPLDIHEWEKEMKKAKEEIKELNRKIEEANYLKGKVNAASGLLASLESELAAIKNSSTECVADAESKNELEKMKLKTEKAIMEANRLKEISMSLKNELETEKSNLANLKQREGMASVAVASLESDLERMKSEIASTQMRKKEANEKATDLPNQLQAASQDADDAKSAAESAREALRKAEKDAEEAKAVATTVESRLIAAEKEKEAARVSEKLATDSIRALQESESTQSEDRITIPLEEYSELKNQEAQANTEMAADLAQIEAAKEEEMRSVMKLEEANRELATRKEVFKAASSKAERASEAMLSVEQELRKCRAENEQRRKADVSPKKGKEGYFANLRIATSSKGSARSDTGSSGQHDQPSVDSSPDVKGWKKKKKQFFPRFLTFFNKKKHASKA